MDDDIDRAAHEDLALIRQMMEAGRRRAAFDGSHLIIWGGVLMVAYFLQYLRAYGYVPLDTWMIWLPLIAIGWVLSWRHDRSRVREDRPNAAVQAYTAAWSAVGVTMLLHFFAALAFGTLEPRSITLLACGVIAAAFHVIATATQARMLHLVSAGWWLIMVYATIVKDYDAEMLLVLAGASAVLIVLPGQLMKRLAPLGASDEA